MSGDSEATAGADRIETAYHAPDSIPAVHRRLDRADGETAILAGGQTLSLLLSQGFLDPDSLVDVTRVSELSGVTTDGSAAQIGATTTYADLADDELTDRIGALDDACAVIADRQVRNAGTVGGAVCHGDPSLDIVAVFRCLGATLRLGSVAGRRSLPLGEFQIGHMRTDLAESELLETITVSLPGERTGTAYEKHAPVEAGWTTVGAAAWLRHTGETITDARVALTAVGDTAVRAGSVEAELTGGPATREAVSVASELVQEDIDPIDDSSGSAAYKRALAPTIVERSLGRALDRAGGPE